MGCSVAAAPLEKVLICPMKRSCQANEGRYKPSAWVLGSGRSCIRKRRSWYSGQRPFRTTMENYSTLHHRARSIPGERGTLRDQLFTKMMTSTNSTRVKAPDSPAAGTPSAQVADLTAVGQSSIGDAHSLMKADTLVATSGPWLWSMFHGPA